MSGIFGNTAEDRFHSMELDKYLELSRDISLCEICGVEINTPKEEAEGACFSCQGEEDE